MEPSVEKQTYDNAEKKKAVNYSKILSIFYIISKTLIKR